MQFYKDLLTTFFYFLFTNTKSSLNFYITSFLSHNSFKKIILTSKGIYSIFIMIYHLKIVDAVPNSFVHDSEKIQAVWITPPKYVTWFNFMSINTKGHTRLRYLMKDDEIKRCQLNPIKIIVNASKTEKHRRWIIDNNCKVSFK